ncbi:MAG: type II toxin-antitoxin system HipA family toxin [Alphaproteobacteria bacterium]|nr:type II toxin-antitoxin system HipA family toxin [Alphaproteobacteria bacterium]
MARTLDVYLNQNLAGYLVQDDEGRLVFTYATPYLERGLSLPLSYSLPLRKEPFSSKECRGFFSGILPEGDKREMVARNLGITARNDFSMLDKIGGECAGAISFMRSGEPLPEHDYKYRTLSDIELETILNDLPSHPLMAGEDGIRLSLAGAQDKLPVHVAGNHVSLPLGNAQSTHILKPQNTHFKDLVFNEFVCMQLAESIGLPTAKTQTRRVGDIDYLLVERYDREEALLLPRFRKNLFMIKSRSNRLHQEDFCQAMGIVSENKYQCDGGPSLKQCFSLLRNVSTSPAVDLIKLLDTVIFNYIVGNNDAHGKNFSIIYNEGSLLTGTEARLAPLYDILCTTYYPQLSKKMAMKIGGESVAEKIFPLHFEKLAEEVGLAKPLVKKRVYELAGIVSEGLQKITINHPTAEAVIHIIQEHTNLVISRFKA